MSEDKKSVESVFGTGKFFTILATVIIIYFAYGFFTQKGERSHEVRSCEEWKKMYPTITNVEPNGFTLGKGTWILEVNSKEWKQINFTQHTSWVSEYTGTTQTRTPDGGTMSGPGNVDYRDIYDSLEFKGKGCILVTTNKNLQLRWKNAKPANLNN